MSQLSPFPVMAVYRRWIRTIHLVLPNALPPHLSLGPLLNSVNKLSLRVQIDTLTVEPSFSLPDPFKCNLYCRWASQTPWLMHCQEREQLLGRKAVRLHISCPDTSCISSYSTWCRACAKVSVRRPLWMRHAFFWLIHKPIVALVIG